ncbi:glycosyltransferase family 1 protein [Microbacteriaceae bacterium VKM Ac-2854]|nr:glycosyltransferase family 1 protein [Microbacteriaceae bacterium VKM Ac-2854]
MTLAVLSNDRLDPWINWSTLAPPLLGPLAERTGRLVSPPPLNAPRGWPRTLRSMRRSEVFWMQQSARPEWPLVLASFAAGPTRRAAFVVDPWLPDLPKIALAARLQRLDPLFVPFRQAADELTRRHPNGRFDWLPFGVDTDVFRPGPGERDVFAFSMGRRYEPLHRALLTYCAERGLEYRYRREGELLSPQELGELAGRARYFVVTPPDFDDAARTGGYSPLVMRYLEGLAAGARLLGVLPSSGEYERLLPVDAILQVRADGADLAQQLDDDPPVDLGAATAHVREHHSWARRAEQIADRLRTGTPIAQPGPPVAAGNDVDPA